MPYTPNATDAAEPTASRELVTAAEEFRTLKGSVNTRLAAVEATQLRTIRVPESAVSELPIAATRRGKFFVFDAAGSPAVASGIGGDVALREDLAETTGSALVGYGATTVAEAIQRIPEWFGAVPGGSADQLAELTAFARATVRPDFVYSAAVELRVPADFATVQDAIKSLKRKRLPDDVNFIIRVSGKHTYSTPVLFDAQMPNVSLMGDTPAVSSITSMVGVAGSAGAYYVEFGMADTSGVAVNDYVIIRGPSSPLIGNPLLGPHWGCWKVTAKLGSSITVLNTCRYSSLPTSPVTGATATIIKTVLTFTDSQGVCTGPGADIGNINNLVIAGVGAGTAADYGLVAGYRPGTQPVGASSNIRSASSSMRVDENVGVVNWGRSGVWVGYGASLYCEGRMASCSNIEAGFEADTGGFITMGWYKQQAVANGNGRGVLAYNSAGIWAGGFLIACGNDTDGITSSIASGIVLGNIGCEASYNKSNGISAEDSAGIFGQKLQARYNGSSGIRGIRSGSVVALNSNATNNGLYGFYSAFAGSANAGPVDIPGVGRLVSTAANNTSHGVFSLNGDMDVSYAQVSASGGNGVHANGGRLRAVGASCTGSTSFDFNAVNRGYIDATDTSRDGALAGASYYADRSGFILATGAATSGATFTPSYNTLGNGGALIALKDIATKQIVGRYYIALANTVNNYTPDIDNGQFHSIEFSGTAAFTINAPTNFPTGAHEFTLQIKNNNGATAVTPAFSSAFVVGTLAPITAGKNSIYTFKSFNGTKYLLQGKLEDVTI